jgi:hypothetical protein
MRQILRALAFLAMLLPGVAAAQCNSSTPLPINTVLGRLGVTPGPCQAIPFSTLLSNLPGAQSANKVYASAPSGAGLSLPAFRLLVGADLPVPGASSLGGVQSLTCSTSNWFNTLSTAGVLGCSRPNFTDLAGSIAAAQIPAGTIVDAAISASAAIQLSKLATQNANTTVCNPTGGAAVPIACTQTQLTAQVNVATNSLSGAGPALPNDGTKFLNGLGVYATPISAGQMILLNTLTASNSATLSDTTSLTSTYSVYEIVFENILPATNATTCELQIHSGGSFQATGYTSTVYGNANGAAMVFSNATTFIACALPADAPNTAATGGINGTLRISSPSSAGFKHSLIGQFGYLNSGGANYSSMNVGGLWNTAGAIDGFQVLFSAGNITSGVIKIYGIQ